MHNVLWVVIGCMYSGVVDVYVLSFYMFSSSWGGGGFGEEKTEKRTTFINSKCSSNGTNYSMNRTLSVFVFMWVSHIENLIFNFFFYYTNIQFNHLMILRWRNSWNFLSIDCVHQNSHEKQRTKEDKKKNKTQILHLFEFSW